MNFTYRGIHHEQEPLLLEVLDHGKEGGKYRGQSWKHHYLKHIPQTQPKLFRQYRGVAYSARSLPLSSTPIEPKAESVAPSACSCILPQPMPSPKILKTAQLHLENMRRNLKRRLEVAKQKGDQRLIQLLEREYQQLEEAV